MSRAAFLTVVALLASGAGTPSFAQERPQLQVLDSSCSMEAGPPAGKVARCSARVLVVQPGSAPQLCHAVGTGVPGEEWLPATKPATSVTCRQFAGVDISSVVGTAGYIPTRSEPLVTRRDWEAAFVLDPGARTIRHCKLATQPTDPALGACSPLSSLTE
jgi:hypothetical protein